MKIVADNHVDSLLRPGADASRDALALDVFAADLRALFGDDAADLPEALVALAHRLDDPGRELEALAV